jgi:hypothetical protein
MQKAIENALRNLLPSDSPLLDDSAVRCLASGVFNYLKWDGWALESYRLEEK